jgi:L,D-transpeptidase YcbB
MGRDLIGRKRLGILACAIALAAPVAGIGPAHAARDVSGGEIAAFYQSRGGAPLWLSPRSGAAAQQLIQLLATAQADNLNPRRYNARNLERALRWIPARCSVPKRP